MLSKSRRAGHYREILKVRKQTLLKLVGSLRQS